MQTDDKIKTVRRRLLTDFRFYAAKVLKIRTKAGEIKPLILNKAQNHLIDLVERQLATTGRVRIIIPKARQLGLSTVVGAWQYWWASQRKAQKGVVVTHKADATRSLFDMTKRYHDNCPEILKPHTKYSSRTELVFDVLDSSYVVATAGGDGIVRGETITVAHLSEMAWWPASTAKTNLAGLLQAVPSLDGTAVFIESTANGVTGAFYDMTQGALKGENGYEVCFLPWFWDDTYREPVNTPLKLTPEEEDLRRLHDLDDEQLMFRRRKIAQVGLDQWNQEYPTVLDDAFLTSGRPVFDVVRLHKALKDAPDPIARKGLVGGDHDSRTWEDSPRGELLIYHPHDPGATYYIGADVAMGLKNGDFSVAQVLDHNKRQVAVWRGHVHPDYFASILYHLGFLYNTAKIAVEINNHGLLTGYKLFKDMSYPNFFTEVIEDKVSDRDTMNLGFKTTMKTKPMIIDDLRATLRDDAITVNDKITLREMMTFVVTESGKLEADEGCFDDTVMALAICNHIHEGVWTPVSIKDDWYVNAI